MNAENVIRALRCPIDWSLVTENREAANWFYFLWVVKVRSHERDRESNLFTNFDDDYEPDYIAISQLNSTEIRAFEFNNELWAEKAHQEYIEESRRFAELKCCGVDIYPKHYVATDLTDEEVRHLSSGKSASLLLPRFDEEQQTKLLWDVLGKHFFTTVDSCEGVEHFEKEWELATKCFWNMYGRNNFRVYVEILERYQLGSVKGALTNYCCFDIDFSTPQFHTFPVLHEEFIRSSNYVYTDTYWLDTI